MVNWNCYDKGEGVSKDSEKTVYLWSLAAERGDTEAMFELGIYYSNKLMDKLIKTGKRKTTSIKAGITNDFYMVELWFTEAAKKGHVKAQCFLGAYYHISGPGPNDSNKALYWCNKAANQGDADAQFLLGNCYAKGEGIPKDPDRAAYWWSLAAAQGNFEAKERVGKISNSFLLYHSMKDQYVTLGV